MIRNIIWDAGGTLFDTYPAMTQAFLSALGESGIQAPAEWVRGLAQVSQRHCAETLAAAYHLDYDNLWQRYKVYLASAPPEQQPPFPGAREVCQWIGAHGGKNLMATHRARELTEKLLGAHGLTSLFSGVVTIFDGYPRKPDPAMLLALAEQHRLARGETLAVGDREIDLQAGRAAGMLTCLFRGAEAAEADFKIQEYRQLEDLLSLMYSLMEKRERKW